MDSSVLPQIPQLKGYGLYEQERCPFWDKVGSCRHGAQCVRFHERPKQSKTLVFRKLFDNPIRTIYNKPEGNGNGKINLTRESKSKNEGEFVVMDVKIDENYLNKIADQIYQDLFVEFALKYGEVDNITICGNFNTHIGGNVIVKFKDERSANKCYTDCIERWYNERPLFCELSPIKNIDNAVCKRFTQTGRCERGDQCNLIHVRNPNHELKSKLLASQRAYYKDSDL